jgi:hypothetical protein
MKIESSDEAALLLPAKAADGGGHQDASERLLARGRLAHSPRVACCPPVVSLMHFTRRA